MAFKSLIVGVLAGATALSHSANFNPSGFADISGGSSGVTVLDFLRLPSSARGVGLGGSTLTTDEEASLIQGNPALLALVTDYYYSVSHAEILGEFRHENIALTWPTPLNGNFGGSIRILAATPFEGARDIEENRANPSAYDLALGIAYGGTLWSDNVNAGGRLDLIRSDLDGTTANGYALNAGLIFMLVSDLRLAFTIQNLSHGISYGGGNAEPLPLGVGLELGKPLLDMRWSGHVGARHGNDGILHYNFGAEWRMIKYLVVRAGYDGSSAERQLGNFAGIGTGIGIKYDRMTFDYGFKALGPLGNYHAFTLNYSRKAKFLARDEVLLEKAQTKYHNGKYGSALILARRAIAHNPYNFKAQALAQKLQLEIDRLDEMAVTIAYTANTDGRLASEWREGRPIGGLPRRKTKLLELKGAPGKVLVLDAGNLTHSGSNPEKEKYVFGAYAQMPYDVINLGQAEVHLGPDHWDSRLPFLSTQKPLAEIRRGLLTEKILPLKRGSEIMVLGALDPAHARGEALGGKEIETVAEAVRGRALPVKEGRIVILLFDGSLATAHRLAAKVPELDVIILSGESQALGSPMKAGKTLICSPGRGGTHVGELTLQLDRNGKLRSFRHFLVPLDATIPEEPILKKFLEPVTIDPNKIALDEHDEDYHAQILAYVRSEAPKEGGKLFLRDLRTGNDYRINAPGLRVSHPILGYGKNKVAFEGEDGSGTREIYAFEPGIDRLDTLTALGGRAGDLRWILRNNALLAVYEKDGKSDLLRIDPWSREVRDLTKGRFGNILGFDVVKAGDRLVLNAMDKSGSTLWVTNAELEAPVAIAADKVFLGSPRWNPQGDKVAFLIGSLQGKPAIDSDNAEKSAAGTDSSESALYGELRIFDFANKAVIKGTQESRVRSFSWSADGKRIYYAAGINLSDVNAFHLDSLTLRKVTTESSSPRDENLPRPKMLGTRDGLLFQSTVPGERKILWMDLQTREEKVLVDSSGFNSLR